MAAAETGAGAGQGAGAAQTDGAADRDQASAASRERPAGAACAGMVRPRGLTQERRPRPAKLAARPEAIDIDLSQTAIVVVDMQNAFMSPGGMFDRSSWPIDGAQRVIEPSRRLLAGARAARVSVVYVKMSYNPDLSNAGSPESPNWHKETGMLLMRQTGEWGRYITEGTWDEQVIDELAPMPGEPVVRKQRYSGFAGTSLDHVLHTIGARYLAFIGGATNICVGTTLVDAFFRDYWPVLVEDACFSQCPPVAVEGTIWNVENLFGWVSSVDDLLAAMAEG